MADSIQQGFLRDEDGNLVVTGGEGVTGKMDYGFVRDEDTRALVVVGPDGESIGADEVEEALVASGMGVVLDGTKTTARPTGYKVITWVQEEEPEHAAEGDIWIET